MSHPLNSHQQFYRNQLQELLQTIQPKQLLLGVIAGTITGLIGVIRAISYSTLIFSGILASYLGVGVGLTFFSTGIISFVTALVSSFPAMIATPLAAPTAITAALTHEIATDLQGASSAEILITVLAAIALSSLSTGLFLLILGRFKLGNKIRFIPYPVIGGFMAGTGWLLVLGSIQITTDISLSLANLSSFLQPDPLIHWGTALAVALLLLLVSERYQHFLAMPGTLLGLILAFYSVMWATGTSIEQARVEGWLLETVSAGGLWQPLTLSDFDAIHWSAIVTHWGLILSIMLVTLVSLALSNSGIEIVVGQELNFNRELEAIGVANLASGFGSGMAGTQALPSTLLINKIAANSRLAGITTGIFCFLVLSLGSSVISVFPKPILGGVILYLGLSLLQQWIYQAWFKLNLSDYLIVLMTLVVINTVGFLEGITLGFVLSVISFMLNYSQLNVVKNIASLQTIKSNIYRSQQERTYFKKQGEQVYIIELQNYIFFGTADYLLQQVRDRVDVIDQHPLKYLLIDFRDVEGIDASGVLTFIKILKLARQYNLTVVYTNLSPQMKHQLQQGGGLDEQQQQRCQILPDLDRGLEWCENQLLQQTGYQSANLPLQEKLSQLFLTPQQAEAFMKYLTPEKVDTGDIIFEAEANKQCLYFIESGQVSILLELPDGQTKRLKTHSNGSLLGEMRFYGKPPLSSLVKADCPTQLYRLDRETFEIMKNQAPELTYALQDYIVRLLCDNLTDREEQVRISA